MNIPKKSNAGSSGSLLGGSEGKCWSILVHVQEHLSKWDSIGPWLRHLTLDKLIFDEARIVPADKHRRNS